MLDGKGLVYVTTMQLFGERVSLPLDKAHFSDFVLRAQDGLHPEVAIMIENVLETNGPKVKLPKQPGKREDQPLNLPLIPSYTTRQGATLLSRNVSDIAQVA